MLKNWNDRADLNFTLYEKSNFFFYKWVHFLGLYLHSRAPHSATVFFCYPNLAFKKNSELQRQKFSGISSFEILNQLRIPIRFNLERESILKNGFFYRIYILLKFCNWYRYCGHGSGAQYLSSNDLKRAFIKGMSLLFGCSSNVPKNTGGRTPCQNDTYTYLTNGCPCTIGCLYDVSSSDADKACIDIMSNILPIVNETGICLFIWVFFFNEKYMKPIENGRLNSV